MENFKFTVKVNNSHVFFQTKTDKVNRVLSEPSNMPKHWLKSPTSEQVDTFEKKIVKYEKESKHVRKLLINGWIEDVVKDCEQSVDPVRKLSFLRTLQDNIWPCPECSELGKHKIHFKHIG